MHKIFAKPQFFGKKVQFLTECHSTNEELASEVRNSKQPEGFVIYTDHQTGGKGQRGNIWVAEPGKNILLSLLLRPNFIHPSEHFLLNLITALSVKDVIHHYNRNLDVKLKWPNDVYVKDKKICGILIEGIIKGEKLDYSIVGIGFNLNQSGFNLPNATSLLLETNEMEYVREDFIEILLIKLEFWYLKLKARGKIDILDAYYKCLMGYKEIRTFQDDQGAFTGIIEGIDDCGRLLVQKNGSLKAYDLKEISFLET